MKLTNEHRKQLIEVFPFLQPRNVWTGNLLEDYDYTWLTGVDEIPEGWGRLFLLFCKNLRPHLVKTNFLDKFMFTQVKEKYGTLRIYHNGIPESASYLESTYEAYSANICQRCGNPAEVETLGWTGYFCISCIHEVPVVRCARIPEKTLQLAKFSKEGRCTEVYTLKYIDKEYKKTLRMSDAEFLDYIVNV